MEFNSLELLKWVTRSIAPPELLRIELTLDYFNDWQVKLNNVYEEWKLVTVMYLLGKDDDLAKRKWLSSLQSQLVMMSNLVNQYLYRDQKYWQAHTFATPIKINYGKSIAVIENLLSFFEQQFPDFNDPNIDISDFRLRNILPPLRHVVSELKGFLDKYPIDPELANIIIKAFIPVLSSGKISNSKAKYIMYCIQEIERLELVNDKSLIDLLIKIDFNQPELYLYIANMLTDRIQKIEGLHEAIEYTLLQKNSQQTKNAKDDNNKLYPNQISLKKELQEYYNETMSYLESMLLIRRQALNDKYDSDHAFRIMIGMSVPQFALFVRILKEKGILIKDGVTEMYTFFAHHFYTDKATFISSKNLLKRSTDVEFATALKLWDSFAEMMDWLDEKFSIRNYQRSTR